MASKNCVIHADRRAVAKCGYCEKRYCAEDLYLQGRKQVVICKPCYNDLVERIKKGIILRRIYSVFEVLIGLAALAYWLYLLLAQQKFEPIVFLVVLATIVVFAMNLRTINRLKEVLYVKKYPSKGRAVDEGPEEEEEAAQV